EGAEAAIGGGVESITMTPESRRGPNEGGKGHQPRIFMVMGETAEGVGQRYHICRLPQDGDAPSGQQRPARAQPESLFDEELAPLKVVRGIVDKKTGQISGQEEHFFAKDECNRPDTTLEGLQALKPYFDPNSGQGTVTAGNASQLSDGASATLLMSRQR